MPSPFPGMDPYLEVQPRWLAFHGWFVRELARLTLPRAQELGCWIEVGRVVYQRESSGGVVLVGEPDMLLEPGEEALTSPGGVATATATLAQPRAVHEVVLEDGSEEHRQEYLVVRELADPAQRDRVLAVVELLSPANKERDEYGDRYREKRVRYLASRSHFMEIDLLRDGHNPSRELFPELPATPYFVFVARKTALGRLEEGHPVRLQDPLPIVGLPLDRRRGDLPLDLAAALRSAYDLTVQGRRLGYGEEPVPGPPLVEADAAWVQSLLRPQRSSQPSPRPTA